MTKAKRSKKNQTQQHTMLPTFGWSGIDRVFDNFRRDFERTFASFPTITSPTIPVLSSTCDLVDEGNRYVIKVDLPGVKKKDIDLNITDNSVEISAEHKEETEVLRFVTYDPVHIDEIIRSSGVPISTVSGTLAMMELKGLVKQVGGMNYIRLKEAPAEYQAV